MPVPSPLVIPWPLPAALTEQDIADQLQVIYSSPPALAQYGCFFFLHEFTSDDFLDAVGHAEKYPDTDVLIQKFYQYKNDQAVQLYVHNISAMESSATAIFSGNAEQYKVFISLDKIAVAGGVAKVLVPYQAAKLLSAAFIHGLTTRLLLDKYKQAWATIKPNPVSLWTDLPLVAAPPVSPSPHPVPAMNAAAWAQSYLATLNTNLTQPKTWTTTSAAHGNLNYFGCLNIMTDSSLQAVGMIMGWLAGDAITDPAFGAGNTTNCQNAIWKLLKNDYTNVDIGTLAGYTFTYLNGFLLSERTKATLTGNSALPPPVNNPTTGPTTIYGYLSNNATNQTDFTPLATSYSNFIVREFYAIAGPNTNNAADKYGGFIEGLTKGLLIGADALYGELFEEGYQLGYTNGFSTGYAQGYAAGWTEGYAVGYQQGQNTWMSGLQNIISGASGTSGLTGLLNDAGTLKTLLTDVGTVGTVIASIF